MHKKILPIIAVVLLLAGLGLLLFPTISNYFGQKHADAQINEFTRRKENVVPSSDESGTDTSDSVLPAVTARSYAEALQKGEIDDLGYIINESGERISDSPVVFEYDLDALYRDSLAYNKSLIHHQGTIDTVNYDEAALDMGSYGLSYCYCYISAPSIGLELPVYLGANDEMMSYGAAHLAGTSLPVDQTDTNAAIAGHTDYIGRIFFDNIRKLDYGDTVTVSNYWETINYEVIDYKIVPEDMTDDLYIEEGRQLLTLITCIRSDKPDVFDRYLVICEKKS